MRVKLASGDAPDVFGVHPGAPVKEYAKAGYLMELGNEPYIKDIQEGALLTSRGEDGKIYSIPTDQNVLGVVYNRKVFKDLGLSVPTDWKAFLDVCEKIKGTGMYPLALGNKDLWITQLIPFAMAPSMIYSKNINFDKEMYQGKRKFLGPEWRALMQRYMDLDKRGYFHPGVLGTTYDQTIQLMATGKAAMVVNGNWILPGIRGGAPDSDLGMFPLPAVEKGEPIWVSAAVGATLAVSSKTKHPAEARKYLAFWMRPDIARLYLMEKKAFTIHSSISVDFDPAISEIAPYLSTGKTYPFLDQNWPTGPQDTLQKVIQEVFIGAKTIDEALASIDAEWKARTGN
jgi:raffinose/stachyose/melibiose transport system substrate-binding protein